MRGRVQRQRVEIAIFETRNNLPATRVSKCFVRARKVPAYIYLRTRAATENRLCTITAGTLQKEILALSARRCSICNSNGDLRRYAHKHRSSSTMGRR